MSRSPSQGFGQAQEIQILPRPGHRLLHRRHQIGSLLGKGRHERRGRCQEDARVPQVAPLGQHGLGPLQRRLFHEALHRPGLAILWRSPHLDPAIAGFRPVGPYPEGHDLPRCRPRDPGLNRCPEGIAVGNAVIGRHDQQKRVRMVRRQVHRRRQNRRAGILRRGFDHDRTGPDALNRQLLGHDEAEISVGDDQRAFHARRPQHPAGRRLEQRPLPGQRHKLLGKAFSRHGPQAGARPTAQKNWENLRHALKQLQLSPGQDWSRPIPMFRGKSGPYYAQIRAKGIAFAP